MISRALGVVMLLAAVAGASGCKGDMSKTGDNAMDAMPASGPSEPVSIQRHLTGDDSGIKTPAVVLVNSRDELTAMGSVDLVNAEVNFDEHSLIVLALGERPTGGYAAKITGVQKRGNEIYVQGYAARPSPDAMVTQVITYPYDAVVVPKMQGSIRSEVDSVVGDPGDEMDTAATPAQ